MAEDKLNQLKKMLSQKESDKRIAELLTAVLERVVQKDGYTPQKGIDYFDGEKGEPFRYIDFTPQQLADYVFDDNPITVTEITKKLNSFD